MRTFLLLLAATGSVGCSYSCDVRIQSSPPTVDGGPVGSPEHGQLDLYKGKGGAAGPVEVQLAMRMKGFDRSFIHRLAQIIESESHEQGLDPMLVLAVIDTESSFNPRAISYRDAKGLMQLRKRTMEYEAHRSGLVSTDPMDPVANVRAGIRYLGRLRRAFRRLEVTLIAYNAGPHRVWEWRHSDGGQIPGRFYRYPKAVLRKYRRYHHASFSYPVVASR